MSKFPMIWSSVLAGLQVFSGGAALTDALPKTWVGLFVLAVAALQAGTVYYQHQAKPAEIDAERRKGADG